VPESFLKTLSPAQHQWWTFKATNFDAVLLFKVGKFYELFEMDAYAGVDVCGLSFMNGEQPHAGFPEAGYHAAAEALARAGHRVVVVEQTETPADLERRNVERKRCGQKPDKVVRRERVAVLSKGTLVDAEMVAARPDAAYLVAVVELDGGEDGATLGLCLADAASGQRS